MTSDLLQRRDNSGAVSSDGCTCEVLDQEKEDQEVGQDGSSGREWIVFDVSTPLGEDTLFAVVN